MTAAQLRAIGAAMAVLALAASAEAQRVTNGGWTAPPVPRGATHGVIGRHGFHGFHGFGVPWYVTDREVVHVIEREIIREVPAAPPAPPEPPPPPRKPYVIGASYASLPGGCMKMIEAGGSYFYCSGEWYRQVGKQYLAVREP